MCYKQLKIRSHSHIILNMEKEGPNWNVVLILLGAIAAAFLFAFLIENPALDEIKRSGKLVVVTRNAPTTYYELHDENTGFEYELAREFAKHLDVKLEIIVKDSLSEILSTIDKGEAHLAAAGITNTKERRQDYIFGPTYQSVQQQVICKRGGNNPKKVNDLIGIDLVVPSDTSYVETLNRMKRNMPELFWSAIDNTDTESLLELIWLGNAGCTIADSNIFAVSHRYYPELAVRFNLTEPQPLAWLLPKHATGLQDEIDDWLDDYSDSGQLEELLARYYGFIDEFDYVDTRRFTRRIKTLLPQYKPVFKRAAKKYDFEWTLLAAQAYQESHWKKNAKSRTGVRGIMMLTQNTAKELGIEDRLDPVMSIWGGARYLKRLHKRIPESVTEPDRTWFALAAYNVGLGHIHDARELASQMKKNPDSWTDLSEVLPLLSQRKYYKKLKHGYARGREPVQYVNSIRNYLDILHKVLNLSVAEKNNDLTDYLVE